VARFADTVNVDEDHTPWRYEHQFTVAAGAYTFQMAMGAGPNAVGKVEMPLTVEPWNSATFGIGGIAFSTETHPVDTSSTSAAPILEGQGPLVAGGKQFVPATTNRFNRSQQIYFYTEVYDPALANSNPPPLAMQYRVLDRKTGEVRINTGFNGISGYVQPGNPAVPFATRLPVSQLPAGQYRLEVTAAIPSSGVTVSRNIEFELSAN
jgi:hypothetical protein